MKNILSSSLVGRSAIFVPLMVLAACGDGDPAAPTPATDPEAGTRLAGEERTIAREGRIEEGTECMVLVTPDGERWAFSAPDADITPDDYVEIVGELADASICMEGEGTIVPTSIELVQPPARDRDPAQAGGIALNAGYVLGSWAAKGGDCNRPDFQITSTPIGTLAIEASVNGEPETGEVAVGNYPIIDWPDPLPDMPIESRGPDGLAVLRPATDARYDPIDVGSATIEGDGVVFVKCG